MGAAYTSAIIDWRSRFMTYAAVQQLAGRQAAGIVITNGEITIKPPHNMPPYYRPGEQPRLRTLIVTLRSVLPELEKDIAFFAQMVDALWEFPIAYRGRSPNVVSALVGKQRLADGSGASGQVILWPIRNEFLTDNEPVGGSVPWDQRDYRIFWRGQTTGLSYDFGGTELPNMASIRLPRKWLPRWLEAGQQQGLDDFDKWATSYQRLAAALKYRDHPDIDIRLTERTYGSGAGVLAILAEKAGPDICAERLSPVDYVKAMQGSKVRLAIPGNDYPSSLKSDLLSDSVVLMPKPFHEGCWFYGLEPGRHYVETRRDMSDLEEKLQWCRDNDAECREMALEGQRFAAAVFDLLVEAEVQRRTLERVSENTVLDMPWT